MELTPIDLVTYSGLIAIVMGASAFVIQTLKITEDKDKMLITSLGCLVLAVIVAINEDYITVDEWLSTIVGNMLILFSIAKTLYDLLYKPKVQPIVKPFIDEKIKPLFDK